MKTGSALIEQLKHQCLQYCVYFLMCLKLVTISKVQGLFYTLHDGPVHVGQEKSDKTCDITAHTGQHSSLEFRETLQHTDASHLVRTATIFTWLWTPAAALTPPLTKIAGRTLAHNPRGEKVTNQGGRNGKETFSSGWHACGCQPRLRYPLVAIRIFFADSPWYFLRQARWGEWRTKYWRTACQWNSPRRKKLEKLCCANNVRRSFK